LVKTKLLLELSKSNPSCQMALSIAHQILNYIELSSLDVEKVIWMLYFSW